MELDFNLQDVYFKSDICQIKTKMVQIIEHDDTGAY